MPENLALLSTGQVNLGLSRCGAIPSNVMEEEIEPHFTVVFPLSGVFGVNVEGRRTPATPATAVLFSRGQAHEIDHPSGGYDRSAYISMKSRFAEPFLGRSGRWPVEAGATDSRLDLRLRCLIATARGGHLGALELEEFTVDALGQLTDLTSSSIASGRGAVLDAEEYLSVHFREECSLSAVAHEVGYSPHHLSRTFKQVTGESLSRRRMRLRLSDALSEILSGADDLSTVAIESGFYDHAHMTNSFRTHFGVAPSEVRLVASAWR